MCLKCMGPMKRVLQVLNANLDLSSRPAGDRELGEAAEFSRSIRSWLALQRAVNLSFDSSTADANAAKAQVSPFS